MNYTKYILGTMSEVEGNSDYLLETMFESKLEPLWLINKSSMKDNKLDCALIVMLRIPNNGKENYYEVIGRITNEEILKGLSKKLI